MFFSRVRGNSSTSAVLTTRFAPARKAACASHVRALSESCTKTTRRRSGIRIAPISRLTKVAPRRVVVLGERHGGRGARALLRARRGGQVAHGSQRVALRLRGGRLRVDNLLALRAAHAERAGRDFGLV